MTGIIIPNQSNLARSSGTADFAGSQAPFTIDKRATALAMMYKNEGYIADIVMPRTSVGGSLFTWRQYRGEAFRRQDTRVGRTGSANRSEYGYDLVEAETEDFAWEIPVPQKDVDNAAAGDNPLDDAVPQATNVIELDREIRVAAIVQNPANYAGNTPVTAPADKFDNYSSTTSPIVTLTNILSRMLVPANTMVMAWDKWLKLSMNPHLVRAYNGNEGGSGMIPMNFFEQMFKLKVVTGPAWIDTSSIDLPPNINMDNMVRVWSNDIALLHINPNARVRSGGATWGMTAQWMTRRSYRYSDPRMGVDGGTIVKVGEHVKELVSSKYCGHLIVDAFAD